MNSIIQLNIPFEQLLSIFKQLSKDEKNLIINEFNKEDSINEILSDFQQTTLTDKEIIEEVEQVRAARYARKNNDNS